MGLVITTADAEAGSAGRLVGRIHERRLLDGLIESVEGGGAAALIVGEAGTGKTALLTHVAEVASNRVGLRVLRARGEESEAGLAFAALADMLLPLRERFTELPPAQRHALEGCLALSGGASEAAGKKPLGAGARARRRGGTPLAVLENLSAAAAGPAGPAGPGGIGAIRVFEPARLTLGRVLEHAWGRLFAELPEDTQRALFVVATDGVSGGCHVEAALGRLQLSLADLAPAECRGLVRTTDGEIRLPHPLLRPGIVERTPLGGRAAACRPLAGGTGRHQPAP